ncbi:N-acetyltransferase [Alcaligenaceae bacterium CGII-47]|nr:N-acetyltransferase [Alcaligenaceae bacterium CGII-47]
MTRAISHNAAQHRFEWTEEGHHCVLDYTLADGVAAFTHTGVPVPVEGRGIAAALVQAGLDTARTLGWRVRPVCSYVDAYIRRHPAEQDLLA